MELSDFFEDPAILIGIGSAIALIAAIFILRNRSADKTVTSGLEPLQGLETNVEYEWEIRPNIGLRIAILLVIVGIGIWAWLTVPEARDLVNYFGQFWFIGIWLLSVLFGSAAQAFKYTLTSDGLLRQNLSNKKSDPEVLFLWDELVWFKPGNHGFKFYRNQDKASDNPFEEISDKIKFKGGSSRYVKVGDNATLVNSLIMSRGVPTSPPSTGGNG